MDLYPPDSPHKCSRTPSPYWIPTACLHLLLQGGYHPGLARLYMWCQTEHVVYLAAHLPSGAGGGAGRCVSVGVPSWRPTSTQGLCLVWVWVDLGGQ